MIAGSNSLAGASDWCGTVNVRRELEGEIGSFAADAAQGVIEALTAIGVAIEGVGEEGEQAFFDELQAGQVFGVVVENVA